MGGTVSDILSIRGQPHFHASQQIEHRGVDDRLNRILVLGPSGAGKSSFARELGKILDIETIHLDSHYWQPHWNSTPPEEWHKKLKDLLKKDRWVMDGNYPDSLPLRLEYANTAIFLDCGRVQSLQRCVIRFLKYRGQSRPELAPGCYEKIDWDFLKWIWNYPRDVKPRVMEALKNQPAVEVIMLKNDSEIARFLKEQKAV